MLDPIRLRRQESRRGAQKNLWRSCDDPNEGRRRNRKRSQRSLTHKNNFQRNQETPKPKRRRALRLCQGTLGLNRFSERSQSPRKTPCSHLCRRRWFLAIYLIIIIFSRYRHPRRCDSAHGIRSRRSFRGKRNL